MDTIAVDSGELTAIAETVLRSGADTLVIGYPRNQSGETTKQTEYVEQFAEKLRDLPVKIEFRDESLTSVLAERRLSSMKKPYVKSDIDAMAACIILEQYLEELS
jgi:putative Holliday junction resolvase